MKRKEKRCTGFDSLASVHISKKEKMPLGRQACTPAPHEGRTMYVRTLLIRWVIHHVRDVDATDTSMYIILVWPYLVYEKDLDLVILAFLFYLIISV